MEKLIFIVDDEQSILKLLTHWVKNKWKYEVKTFESATEMLNNLDENPDLILLDIMLPDMNGIDVLRSIKKTNQYLPIIMLSAQGSIEIALESLKIGAFDYFPKPVDQNRLEIAIKNAIQNYTLHKRVKLLLSNLQKEYSFDNIVSVDKKMNNVFSLVQRVLNNDITVLIQGESGTGKELIAKAIHFNGKREAKPFVVVNCASIPRELLESELFGHEKGSFTGAIQRKIGKFEMANGGTIFLDEIAELEMSLQAKILRVIQEKQFERVGGNEVIKTDVRILSATNKDLEKLVANGEFREDLYFRLNSFPINLPPLRERREDIVILIDHFIKIFNTKMEMNIAGVTPKALKLLYNYDWPGNVRELENTIERAMILSDGNKINEETLPKQILKSNKEAYYSNGANLFDMDTPILPFEKIKEQAIRHAIKVSGGNIQEAARKLDLGRATIYRLIEKYNIEVDKE